MVIALRKDQRGQTTVEWLMLMGAAFITSYLVLTGPLSSFTNDMLINIRQVTGNIVRNGELTNEGRTQGSRGHPSDKTRLRPLHL